jgi:hypothetical protein
LTFRQIQTAAGPVGAAAKLAVDSNRCQRYRGQRGSEATAQPRACDIFLSGIEEPTKTNANVRGSNAAFDLGADATPTLTSRRTALSAFAPATLSG